jgi:hypothetical protein
MKLRNLMKTPLSFNLSDGTPVHLASREELTGFDEKVADDPQVTRRVRRGYIRVKAETPKASTPKAEEKSSPPKGKKKAATGGESKGPKARKREGEENKSEE